MKEREEYCYLLCSVKDDLPVLVCDTYNEIMEYLDIKRTTAWKMVKNHAIIKDCYVETVLL